MYKYTRHRTSLLATTVAFQLVGLPKTHSRAMQNFHRYIFSLSNTLDLCSDAANGFAFYVSHQERYVLCLLNYDCHLLV